MRRIHITIVVAVGVAIIGALVLGRALRHPGAVAEMRGVVAALRSAADSCRTGLETDHAALLHYNARLDSMRQRVRDLEALNPRGVPADSYATYMSLFTAYNDSAGQWEGRVERLQGELDACRATAAAHNEALDSLRRLLLDEARRR